MVGRWLTTPFGSFADVMHEDPAGLRTLLAPTEQVAEFVGATYVFDHVALGPVEAVRSPDGLTIRAVPLDATVTFGRRTGIGRLLHLVPARMATAPWWCTAIDPIARVAMRGVRTRGTAGNGRVEWYGATDQHRVDAVRGTLGGDDLGALADVWPPVHFGFSSTPRTPSVVAVTTTIRRP